MIRLRIAVIATLCLACATAVFGQQKTDSEQTLKIDTALVSVPVIVSDRQGRYVSGLKASDFTLYEDRTKRQIDFFADTEEPINVALLLDTSRSTTLVLDDIKQAAKDFVRQLRSQDRAMIVTFDHDETALCELTSDHKILERAISRARIGERVGTKLRDAVYDVMTEELKSVKGRKAIVVLTDGKDHGSEIGEGALLDGAAEADTLIYSVFYTSGGPGQFGMPRNPQGRGGRGGWGRPRGGRRGGIFSADTVAAARQRRTAPRPYERAKPGRHRVSTGAFGKLRRTLLRQRSCRFETDLRADCRRVASSIQVGILSSGQCGERRPSPPGRSGARRCDCALPPQLSH